METKNAWLSYKPEDKTELNRICEAYKQYISLGKTERECYRLTVGAARQAGYISLEEAQKLSGPAAPGTKIYAGIMGKAVALFCLGSSPMQEGMNILGAHIDSPRLDVKQNPLYEESGLAYLDTHYYGGIKKYQWAAIPMALHGVAVRKDGSTAEIVIGEDAGDPVVGVTDLLIHLAADQMAKTASVVIEGENLDLLIGSEPVPEEKKEGREDLAEAKGSVLKNIKAILKEKYNIEEEDFLSAELEAVPAGPARDMGLDRSMVLGYGQDDRICAFTSLEAMLQLQGVPAKTSVCLLVDKEEIGSMGATGMQSRFFENAVAEVMELSGQYSELGLRRCLSRSRMLSSDVNAGFDPLYSAAFEKKNASFLGHGLVFCKFTGARGKSGSNDCSAEYMAVIRRIMEDAGVYYQTAELGKVDVGGGGTIAYIAGNYGMEVIDAGVAILSMHAPYETASKADIFEAVKGYRAFLERA